MPTLERTQKFFDGYAADFDALYGTRRSLINRVVNPLLRRSMKLRYQRTLESCDPIEGAEVLDVGCGPGHYLVALLRRGAARAVGLDFAEGMLEIAGARAETCGVADRCELVHTSFEDFEPKRPFDYVILNGFMDYTPDPATIIRKAMGMATRRGFFSFPAAGGILGWQRRFRYRSRCDLYLYDRPRLEGLFSEFENVSIETIARDYFVRVDIEH